jgi:outer membrane protein assembly factor BamB
MHEALTTTPDERQPVSPRRKGIRWWPALAIVALAAVLFPLGFVLPRIAHVGQHRSMWMLSVVGGAVLALVAWLVLASRLPLRIRKTIGMAFLVIVAGTAFTFRIEGMTGDLRPIIGLRFHLLRPSGANDQPLDSHRPLDLTKTSPTDYPRFLGPREDATVRGVRLETDWQAHPPKLLWRHPVGEAWSAFAVVGDYAITQEQDGKDELIVCYELRSGKPLWRYRYPAEFRTVIAGTGPRATPTVAAGRVYTMGATGILVCLDGATGGKLWSRDTLADAAAVNRKWGNSCSPLVLDDKVIISAGGENGWSLVAYHKDTGEVLWHGGDAVAGYASPRLTTLCGVPQLLILNDLNVAAHDPLDGRVLWEYPFGAGQATAANPIPIDERHVLLSAGYGYGCLLLELAAGADGKFAVTEAWPRNRNLKMKCTNGVLREGHVYGLDDGVLACLEVATGRRRWRAGRYGHGQLLLVDDLLLVQGETGEVFLVRANPQRHEELTRFQALNDKTWNNPVLVGSLLLVRNDKEAACYELPVIEE